MPFADKERNREWHRNYMRAKRVGELSSSFRILERDSFRCQYCGRTPKDGIQLQVDHIVPKSLGGGDEDDNLVTACAPCNASKGGRLLRKEAEEAIYERILGVTVTPTLFDAEGNPIYEEDL